MRTASIFKSGNNRAIRQLHNLDFGGGEQEIVREGDNIILRPVRPTWGSFTRLEKPIWTLWPSARTLSAMKDDLTTCKQNLYARHAFTMHEQPEAVLKRLKQAVLRGHRIVVSAITINRSVRLLSLS